MNDRPSDLAQLRVLLRQLSRGKLLIIAERAVKLVPSAGLASLLGDFLQIEVSGEARKGPSSLLDEVREFHATSLSGAYYESFTVNGQNFTQQSKGTDAFVAEFDRLVTQCICEADTGPKHAVREAFELLFGLLRHIDEGHDDVLFFADEGSSHDVGVPWRAVFSAYFRCLAETAAAEEFAQAVDHAIMDFDEHDRHHHLGQAGRVATAAQLVAIGKLASAPR